MQIYTYGRLNKPAVYPTEGLVEAVEKEWTVDETPLYGYCEYARKLTEEEVSSNALVCLGVREVTA